MHAELRLGPVIRCSRKRVARIMRLRGLRGVWHRRMRGTKSAPATHEDLVRRVFTADRIDRVGFTDITQHRAADGWVYCCAVIDACSRRVVGWSIADHLRTELVADALQMAQWQRRPQPGTVVHSDRGTQYTSWVSGHRLRQAGLLGSIRQVASSVDNALVESFWSSTLRELLDRHAWASRVELAAGMFDWIEGRYNPRRRHSSLGYVLQVCRSILMKTSKGSRSATRLAPCPLNARAGGTRTAAGSPGRTSWSRREAPA